MDKMVEKLRRKVDQLKIPFHTMTKTRKVCTVNGINIQMEISNPREHGRILPYASKEPDTISWLDTYMEPGAILYEIGANIGQYSLYAALRFRGKVQVYSFEPKSHNYPALNRNIFINNLPDSVTSFCIAVSNGTQINLLNVHGQLRAGEAIHQFGSTVDACGISFNAIHRQGMLGVSLDDLHFLYGLYFPRCVKIYVDGLESAVIRGASKIINDARLQSALIEITEVPGRKAEVDFIYDVFKNAGFGLGKKVPAQVHDPNYPSCNAIFCR